MIILLLLSVSVSLKGFKDKYLSLVSMTLIGNEDFGVTNLFIISFYDTTGTFLKNVTSIGHFSYFGFMGSFCKHCH